MIKTPRSGFLLCVIFWIVALMSQSYAHAESTPSADDKVDAASRVQIVNSLADKMRDLYVFPDIGEQTAIALKKKLNDGGYDSVKYAVGLSTLLTTDVQAICNDLHLHVGTGKLCRSTLILTIQRKPKKTPSQENKSRPLVPRLLPLKGFRETLLTLTYINFLPQITPSRQSRSQWLRWLTAPC